MTGDLRPSSACYPSSTPLWVVKALRRRKGWQYNWSWNRAETIVAQCHLWTRDYCFSLVLYGIKDRFYTNVSNTTRKSQATSTSWHAAFSTDTQASIETKVTMLTYLSGTTLWLQRGEPEQCRQKVRVWLKFSLGYGLSSCMSTATSCLTFSCSENSCIWSQMQPNTTKVSCRIFLYLPKCLLKTVQIGQ
jgi:hypothetical protein